MCGDELMNEKKVWIYTGILIIWASVIIVLLLLGL